MSGIGSLDNAAGALQSEDMEGLEWFAIVSTGLDIGSSTSHLIIARLTLRRRSTFSTSYEVTERAVMYRSPILMTPYVSGSLIDTSALERFVDDCYERAGVARQEIDAGAVIITGEALRRGNARPIAEKFAARSGKFVCVTAGPEYEALLAAHGSGAVEISRSLQSTVLNVDIGGGTTKAAIIRHGLVVDAVSFSVGARLIAFDCSDQLIRIEPSAHRMAHALGLELKFGERLSCEDMRSLADLMAELIFEGVSGGPVGPILADLMLTPPLGADRGLARVDTVVFSGGVSEYLYENSTPSYGDLGPLLGKAIMECVETTNLHDRISRPIQGIRATVLGAGEYTVQASGQTCYVSDSSVLPSVGLKVIRASVPGELSVESALQSSLERFGLDGPDGQVAIALAIEVQPNYTVLRQTAESIAKVAMRQRPLVVIVDMDVAKSLGRILKEELGWPSPVISLDGIAVGDLDYVDIGERLVGSDSVPVTVKSLMFPDSAS